MLPAFFIFEHSYSFNIRIFKTTYYIDLNFIFLRMLKHVLDVSSFSITVEFPERYRLVSNLLSFFPIAGK